MSAAEEADGAGPSNWRRRRLLRLGTALPLLASCGAPQPYIPQRWQRSASAYNQGFAVIVVRRLTVQGCKDLFRPTFLFMREEEALEEGEAKARLIVSTPGESDWSPDPGRPFFLRTSYALQLPSGKYSFAAMERYSYSTSTRDVVTGRSYTLSRRGYSQTLPLRFEVLPRRAVYIGGLGVRPAFNNDGWSVVRGFWRGCEAEDGSHFFHADPASDIPFVRGRHPVLAGFEIVDRSAAPPGWDGLPAA